MEFLNLTSIRYIFIFRNGKKGKERRIRTFFFNLFILFQCNLYVHLDLFVWNHFMCDNSFLITRLREAEARVKLQRLQINLIKGGSRQNPEKKKLGPFWI